MCYLTYRSIEIVGSYANWWKVKEEFFAHCHLPLDLLKGLVFSSLEMHTTLIVYLTELCKSFYANAQHDIQQLYIHRIMIERSNKMQAAFLWNNWHSYSVNPFRLLLSFMIYIWYTKTVAKDYDLFLLGFSDKRLNTHTHSHIFIGIDRMQWQNTRILFQLFTCYCSCEALQLFWSLNTHTNTNTSWLMYRSMNM